MLGGLGLTFLISGTLLLGSICMYSIYRDHKERVAHAIRQVADDVARIDGAPPLTRQRVDKIEIEDFKCRKCRKEPRDLIFLPCKHCIFCSDCYKEEPNKKKCADCNKKIKKLIRFYAIRSM